MHSSKIIARILVLMFLGIVLAQARLTHEEMRLQNLAKVKRLIAKARENNAKPAVTVAPKKEPQAIPESELNENERRTLLQAKVQSLSRRLSKLVQDVGLLAKSLISSSTDMILSVLHSTSEIMANGVDNMRPLVKNVTDDIQALRPGSVSIYMIKKRNDTDDHKDQPVDDNKNKI